METEAQRRSSFVQGQTEVVEAGSELRFLPHTKAAFSLLLSVVVSTLGAFLSPGPCGALPSILGCLCAVSLYEDILEGDSAGQKSSTHCVT